MFPGAVQRAQRIQSILSPIFVLSLLAGAAGARAQSQHGTIVIDVVSTDGRALAASGILTSEEAQVQQDFRCSAQGRYVAQHLVFATYLIEVHVPGFAPVARTTHLKAGLPVKLEFRLRVASVQQQVSVSAAATLVDSQQPGSSSTIGRSQLRNALSAQPGRSLLDTINDQPGWIFEANGVLHPRGSEYDTQFVVDGVPRTENLSPSFAAPLAAEMVESVQVRTSGIPAEYGRSLGGVIDITTSATLRQGWHGAASAWGGSFASAAGAADLSYGTARQQLSLAGQAYRSGRFLDPPVVANFTNRASAESVRVGEQIDASARDHVEVNLGGALLHEMVPNETVQQQAGQRQDRSSRQQSGSVSWQHTFSPDLLATLAAGVLDTDATLISNAQATPAEVNQDRGFRQTWMSADGAWHRGHNDWKAGTDAVLRHVHEHLGYFLTDPGFFDPDTRPRLDFQQQQWDVEPAAFVEDTLHLGPWNVAAGVRFDDYSFVVERHQWSPRLSVSRFFPAAHMVVHGSYDRIFQYPAVENLLLASSPQLDSVSSFVERLPVQPALANYYELGFVESLGGRLRVAGNIFERRFTNYPDDDTLLNTGVSFPIAYRSAEIHGEELSLDLPAWHGVQAQVSYSNQLGTGKGPLTGGLFLGGDGAQELAMLGRFPISQDQRNSLRAEGRWQPGRLVWVGANLQFNSGLPVELNDPVNFDQLRAAYGPKVLDQVNFVRGRVYPWFAVDVAMGIRLLERRENTVNFELHVANLGGTQHLINFESLFSGTALGPPRSADIRLVWSF